MCVSTQSRFLPTTKVGDMLSSVGKPSISIHINIFTEPVTYSIKFPLSLFFQLTIINVQK